MKKPLFLIIIGIAFSSIASGQSWKTYVGIDGGGWWGLSGMSSLNKSGNPLVVSDLHDSYSYSADFYAEFLQINARQDERWGKLAPGFGIKTKLDWEFFEADNGTGGDQAIGLNYLDVPLLFEYCLSFHEGNTQGFTSPGSSNTQVYDHSYYEHIITTTTSAQYHPAGRGCTSFFIYGGPQICYLFKSYNDTQSGDFEPINNPDLKTSYLGLIGGFTYCINSFNLDISYERGLQSIYNGSNVYINGFLFKIGINFSSRLLNTTR